MLEYVNRDYRIRLECLGQILQIAVMDLDARIAQKPLPEYRYVVRGGFDQRKLAGRSSRKEELGYRSYTRACLHAALSNLAGEGVHDPIVVVPGLGYSVELSS